MQATDSSPASSAATARSVLAVRAVGWLAVALGVGTALLTIGHSGVTVPVVSRMGPGGGNPVWQAAIGFGAATLLFATIAVGVFRRRAWSWPLATVVNGLVVTSGLLQFQGTASALGIGLAAVSIVLLLTPAVRHTLLGGGPGGRRGAQAPL